MSRYLSLRLDLAQGGSSGLGLQSHFPSAQWTLTSVHTRPGEQSPSREHPGWGGAERPSLQRKSDVGYKAETQCPPSLLPASPFLLSGESHELLRSGTTQPVGHMKPLTSLVRWCGCDLEDLHLHRPQAHSACLRRS